MEMTEAQLIPELAKLGMFGVGGFLLSMILTPIYTHFAYKYQWWRKARTKTVDGKKAEVFQKLHGAKHKRNIPTMAGLVVLGTILIITALFNLDRSQTWLPLFILIFAGVLGLMDDYYVVKTRDKSGGLNAWIQLTLILTVAVFGAYWFYFRLGANYVHIPAWGDIELGIWYIPLFITVMFATSKSVGITDGLDGLSGGLLSFAYAAFGVIAFFKGHYGIAAFCFTIVGTMLTYTWFNIHPARFFMGNSGSISLGATLGVVAMLIDALFVLPIIGFLFFVESGSSALQLLSKKIRGKKLFLIAPIHHHFEAMGWPETKVTMRFWIIGIVTAVAGIIVGVIGRG